MLSKISPISDDHPKVIIKPPVWSDRFLGLLILFVSGMWALMFCFHRKFWEDESSSILGVLNNNYFEILIGKTGEGNIAPLMFVILKALIDLQSCFPFLDVIILPRLLSVLPFSVLSVLISAFTAAIFTKDSDSKVSTYRGMFKLKSFSLI